MNEITSLRDILPAPVIDQPTSDHALDTDPFHDAALSARRRTEYAAWLVLALGRAHPDDAVEVMQVALPHMALGYDAPDFAQILREIRETAHTGALEAPIGPIYDGQTATRALIADFMARRRSSPDYRARRTELAVTAAFDTIEQIDKIDHAATVAVLCAALDGLSAGDPEAAAYIDTKRSDADWWAGFASPLELEVYMSAAIKASKNAAFCTTARKRLMATLWNGLSQADKDGFMARFGRVAV